MALVAIIFLAIILVSIILGRSLFFKTYSKLLIAALILLLSFLVLLFFTTIHSIDVLDNAKDYSKIGPYGDYIGGILNPLIAVFAVFAAGFAFYAQYEANKQVQDQFKIQQFESQFYEMLRLHRDNLNEMQIEGYEFTTYPAGKDKSAKLDSKEKKITSGKKVFVTMLKEFEAIHLIGTKVFMFRFNLLSPPQKEQVNTLLKKFIFDHSYFVFFNGISFYKKSINSYKQNDATGFLDLVLDDFVEELESKRKSHLESGIKEHHLYYTTGSVLTEGLLTKSLWLSFNYKPFSGHLSILGHYYRHLFQTVKYVVKQNENLISYEQKRDYLRVLRSVLSSHEQILLYYNWLADFGSQWEEKNVQNRKSKIGNFFFTDYRMIHNIPSQMLLDDFKLDDIFNEDFQSFRYEANRKDEDLLFQLIEIKSKA